MQTNEIAGMDEIRQAAIDYYVDAAKSGVYEGIEAGLTLHYHNGKMQEVALASDTIVAGMLLHVKKLATRGVVVVRLNNTATMFTELKPFNLQ